MKRVVCVLLAVLSLVVCLGSTGCNSEGSKAESKSENKVVTEAITVLEHYWKTVYQDEIGDGYFEIKNTRVVSIKENDTEEFKDVSSIIEFELYTDYFGSAPYYSNVAMHNNVVVYTDGSMEVSSNVINTYRNKHYTADFSGFVESVDDYADDYNCVKDLKV